MGCLHSNNKFTLPVVLFCSSTLRCFPWVLYHFSGLQKKIKFPIFRSQFSELITAFQSVPFILQILVVFFLKS